MRRSTQSSRLSAAVSPLESGLRRRCHHLIVLVLAVGLALGVAAGASGTGLAQGDGFEMKVYVANCQIEPPLPPTLDEAGCAPAVGASVEFVAEDGATLGACTTNEVVSDGTAAGCSVIVPYNTAGQAYLDTTSIDGAFAPRMNPIWFNTPGPGPIDGIVSIPIFVNLPESGGGEQPAGQTDGTQTVEPVEPVEQEAPADRYATVVTGSCAEVGDAVADPIAVSTPRGDRIGLLTAIIAESGGGAIGVALDDLFATPHAIIVITPSDGEGAKVACGDLGTVADDDGIAVIGLHPALGSAMGGIAYLTTDPTSGLTLVSIFLAEGLGGTA